MACSKVHALISESERKAQQIAEGIRHMEFVAKLYRKQIYAGWVLLHEQPASARSWVLPCIRKILKGVEGGIGRGRSVHVRITELGES